MYVLNIQGLTAHWEQSHSQCFLHCYESSSSLVTSALSSLWRPAPGNGNDSRRAGRTSLHQPTGLVLRHLQLAAAARSRCCLWWQQRRVRLLSKERQWNCSKFLSGTKKDMIPRYWYLIHHGSWQQLSPSKHCQCFWDHPRSLWKPEGEKKIVWALILTSITAVLIISEKQVHNRCQCTQDTLSQLTFGIIVPPEWADQKWTALQTFSYSSFNFLAD